MKPAPRLFHVAPTVIAGLLAEGKADPEIARLYGVTTPSVWFYRKKHKLRPATAPRLARVRRDVIEWLVERGLSDAEIGRIFKVSHEAVCAYRYKHTIPSLRPSARGWAA